MQAEADGQSGHGLSRLQSYADQSACGKINGFAVPEAEKLSPSAYRIDAKHGFAFPALSLAVEILSQTAKDSVIGIASIYNSHHCGALGLQVEALANHGLIGLMFANSPEAIAPWGGQKGVFGTNPIAFSAPRTPEPLVIDLGLSVTARGKIMVAAKNDTPIEEGLALDKDGKPTTNAVDAMAGTMLPIGGAKGATLALMVEILSATLTGANMGYEASSFLNTEGEAPSTGQLLIALNPTALSGGSFTDKLEALISEILSQDGTRLPGQKRLQKREESAKLGISVDKDFYEMLKNA